MLALLDAFARINKADVQRHLVGVAAAMAVSHSEFQSEHGAAEEA